MKPTLIEQQSPSGYGKVPFAISGPPSWTNTSDIHKNTYKNIILEIYPQVRQREEAQEEEERKRSGGSEIDPGERKVSEELTVAALPTTTFCPTTTNPG